jgi:hypothetical protein
MIPSLRISSHGRNSARGELLSMTYVLSFVDSLFTALLSRMWENSVGQF